MRLKQYLHSYARLVAYKSKLAQGFSLIELLVSITMSSLIAFLVASMTLAHRNTYQKDMGRTVVVQNIRSAIDIVGNEIKQSGELLPASFPAILVTDNGSNSSDTLTIRRNLLSQVLVGCDSKTAGSSYSVSNLSRSSAVTPACTYANQTSNYSAWFNYVAGQLTLPKAYIYNQTSKLGEFLQLVGTSPANTFGGNNGSVLYLNYQAKTFLNPYSAESTSIYLLNEWKFQVSNGVLQIIENQDTANPQNIIDGISNFQISVLMQDGSTKSSFTTSDSWASIAAVRITITGSTNMPGRSTITKTVTSDFMPRNVLSS